MPHPRTTTRPRQGPHNSLWHYRKDVGLLRVTWNFLWVAMARWAPSFRLKNWMLRRTGARIGKHVSFGLEATLDIFFPQDITVEDEAIVGYDTAILCHAYLHDAYQRGPVTIGRGASLGARCLVLPGVTVGEGAVVGAMSLVNKDIPAGEFWAGVPARKVRDAY